MSVFAYKKKDAKNRGKQDGEIYKDGCTDGIVCV